VIGSADLFGRDAKHGCFVGGGRYLPHCGDGRGRR
jgi:hypothetical protein